MNFRWTLSGNNIRHPDPRVLAELPLVPSGLPRLLEIDDQEVEPGLWPGLDYETEFYARWGKRARLDVREVIIAGRCEQMVRSLNLFAALSHLPFELFTHGSCFRNEWEDLGYCGPTFADRHATHGYACAFRGAGHDRLVSRRWLGHGPWRLIRDEAHDISFVQFHDLEADAETALAQARPGHERMGISDTGGFIQTAYVYETDFKGFYLEDERVLEIVVTGRDVPQVEMLDAAALRHYRALGPEQPLDNVRYVFVMGEAPARAHLHELWLRELECWAIVAGEKVRLDDTYAPPPPETPAWVAEVEAREAAGEG